VIRQPVVQLQVVVLEAVQEVAEAVQEAAILQPVQGKGVVRVTFCHHVFCKKQNLVTLSKRGVKEHRERWQ
jgi:hypothetical protein